MELVRRKEEEERRRAELKRAAELDSDDGAEFNITKEQREIGKVLADELLTCLLGDLRPDRLDDLVNRNLHR